MSINPSLARWWSTIWIVVTANRCAWWTPFQLLCSSIIAVAVVVAEAVMVIIMACVFLCVSMDRWACMYEADIPNREHSFQIFAHLFFIALTQAHPTPTTIIWIYSICFHLAFDVKYIWRAYCKIDLCREIKRQFDRMHFQLDVRIISVFMDVSVCALAGETVKQSYLNPATRAPV